MKSEGTPLAKSDNEIIAEFYGAEYRSGPDHFNPDITIKQWIIKGNPFNQHRDDIKHWYSPEQLMYHTSWDWLMPVVEKIGRIELPNGQYGKFIDFSISTNDGIGWIFWTKGIPGDQNQPQSYSTEGTMIERTYKAVVEFIKWHNNQSVKAS